ncbi:MAG: hypothetical protein ACWGMZ_00760 [Thermoguttaceae bacterium]
MQDQKFPLEEQNIEAQVEWKTKRMQNVIRPLQNCWYDLKDAIISKLNSTPGSVGEPSIIRAVLNPVYEPPNQDEFTQQINAAVGEFEKLLRPHIGK